ncbi:phosphatase inhibitor-domain-containing protein [Pisolithus orientalis]|uniref:phosphatase inhibitor-domain-containing protein n=1 Tax=Pisolithus orientalis TaxID=936130 RepID=UPI00222506B0|nr:phosphatase inhibitor-domain-containing protein [Pisolithus orientalis]KAI5990874.1 phosphatase inhibitor-domain-containing protein [Pisolithus orientalis]
METAPQRHPYTSAPSDGSRTITTLAHETPVIDRIGASGSSGSLGEGGSGPGESSRTAVGTLRLRGASRRNAQRVMWGEDVVDNEGCGKKKSKICCIFHKQRRFDESSSESESDSDSSCAGSDAHGSNEHDQVLPCPHRHTHGPNGKHDSDSDSDWNAYERLPKSQRRKTRRG